MDERDRRDDWKNGVDKKLVDLTSAQRSTDDELDDLDLKYTTLDRIIRGDPETDISGFHERLHNVENGLQDIRAELVKSKLLQDGDRGIRWQSVTAIVVAMIGAISIVLSNMDKLRSVFREEDAHYQPDDKFKREIERDKRRHHKKKIAPLQENTTTQ